MSRIPSTGGGCLPLGRGVYSTPGRHPPGRRLPQVDTRLGRHPLWAGPPPHSPDDHCRGRHASYWNAFLCFNLFFIFFLLFSSGSPTVKTSFIRYKMFGMSSHIWCALFVMVVLTGFGESASILMIPCSHYSYINTFTVFGKTLISAGHEVGWVGNFHCPQTKLPKGNVFTPVCQSFCSRGRGV